MPRRIAETCERRSESSARYVIKVTISIRSGATEDRDGNALKGTLPQDQIAILIDEDLSSMA
jgi:hypothetical protein